MAMSRCGGAAAQYSIFQHSLSYLDLHRIFTILVEECQADEKERYCFVWSFPDCVEYYFRGLLGFGSRVWWSSLLGCRITCYREDETKDRLAIIARTNQRLARLLQHERPVHNLD
jgi:hypothetical protein